MTQCACIVLGRESSWIRLPGVILVDFAVWYLAQKNTFCGKTQECDPIARETTHRIKREEPQETLVIGRLWGRVQLQLSRDHRSFLTWWQVNCTGPRCSSNWNQSIEFNKTFWRVQEFQTFNDSPGNLSNIVEDEVYSSKPHYLDLKNSTSWHLSTGWT